MTRRPVSAKTRTNDPQATRDRILDAAADLFQNKGFTATSTQDILAAAGVTAGALHHHYPTKKSLGLAVIRERVAVAVRSSWIDPVREASRTSEGILVAIGRITSELQERGTVRGCPLNNLVIELGFADPEFRAELQPIFNEWVEAISTCLRQERGLVGDDELPDELATLVVAAYSGAMTMAKATQSAQPLARVMNILDRQLTMLLAPGPTA